MASGCRVSHRLIVAFAVLFSVSGFAVAAETFEDVEKDILAKHEKIKTFAAKMKMSMDMAGAGAGGMNAKMEQRGTIEYMRDEKGKNLSRTELKGSMVMKFGDQEMKQDTETLTITDAEHTYTLSNMMGKKMAMKNKVDPKTSYNVNSMFTEFKKEFDMKLLDPAKVDGKACHVIEAKPKNKDQGQMPVSKMVISIEQERGVPLKWEMFSKGDKPMITVDIGDYKLNEKIDPARFKFTAPEGVQVMDMTKMKPGAGFGGPGPGFGGSTP